MASSSKRPVGSPASRSPSPSRKLTSQDVQQGNILWLAPREETLSSLRKRSPYASEPVLNLTSPGNVPDEGFFNHPIFVISRPTAMSDTIYFLHLTSFSGQKLEKRFRKGPSVANRRQYMTMAPGGNHPLFEAGDPMYRTLYLESGETMERRGYVKISEVYSMNWRDAQPFWRGDPLLRQKTRLDTTSLRLLLFATQQVGHYTPGEQYTPSATGSRTSSSKSSTRTTIAAAKAPQQLPSRRSASLPELGTPLSITVPQTGDQSPPRAPQAAMATTTPRSHPARRRSPTTSLPEAGDRVWDEERQPLLLPRRNGAVVRNGHEPENDVSFLRAMFVGLKNAVFAPFRFLWFVVRFVTRILFA